MAPSPEVSSAHALRGLAWYGQRKPLFTGGNDVTLLKGATDQFPALRASIDDAKRSVWMATYLVSPIGQSQTVLQALARAAQRGVEVHFVVDGVGSRDAPASLWRELEEAGVKLVVYRPVRGLLNLLDSSQWRRMHMKLCVVDDAVGFVGGINLIDDRYDLALGWSSAPRLDYALQVKGAAVMPMAHTVKAMWTRAAVGRDWRDDIVHWMADNHSMKRLRALWQKARLRLPAREQKHLSAASSTNLPMRCAFVLRDNLLQRRTIERAALQAIQHARTRVDIVTPYFYPARALRHALRNAAKRGVVVRLLLQGKADYRIAAIAAQVLYHDLQLHGVRIFEYQPALLHAKVLCVDDEWATIGSSNLDPLSLVLNLEANLVVRDRSFVRTLSAALAVDFEQSTEISPPLVRQRSWVTRVRRSTIAWMAKTYLRLAGVTGRY
ncbi:MAG: cardiolipin synthase ClsB [Leptothrix sp. (in: Bacteria)]|nr:cardiolipin synthase ClsB [Leptothrix sp. (in: b-proteobacteria)]